MKLQIFKIKSILSQGRTKPSCQIGSFTIPCSLGILSQRQGKVSTVSTDRWVGLQLP